MWVGKLKGQMVSWKSSSSFRAAAILVFLLVAGCRGMLNFSPERAVVQEILSGNSFGMRAVPDTVQVLQTKELEGTTFVQVAFQAVDEQNRRQDCLFVYEARSSPTGFASGGGGGGCSFGGPRENAPISVTRGSSSGAGVDYTEVDGFVYQPEIVSVEVTWEDGETQTVDVVNGAYLALRSGIQDVTQIRALDAGGEVVYEYESPAAAPGKQP
ncbi:MAG TPA: hypothetical protein VFZ76_00835 [Anaerolineales bacterium]